MPVHDALNTGLSSRCVWRDLKDNHVLKNLQSDWKYKEMSKVTMQG